MTGMPDMIFLFILPLMHFIGYLVSLRDEIPLGGMQIRLMMDEIC